MCRDESPQQFFLGTVVVVISVAVAKCQHWRLFTDEVSQLKTAIDDYQHFEKLSQYEVSVGSNICQTSFF